MTATCSNFTCDCDHHCRWSVAIWGRTVARDVVPVLQQLPDALNADVLQNLLSMLEATPVRQGVWADNLLQLAKPKNPLSHLLDNTQSVAVVRSEECHMKAGFSASSILY